MSRGRFVTVGLIVVVAAVAVIVVAGAGQGSPPPRLPISAAAKTREVTAVDAADSLVKRGERLFGGHGCDACHTMAAGGYDGRLGPRLDVQSQGDPVKGIEANITDPPTDDKGYEAGLMPDDFGTRLSHADIHALAAYIHAAATAAAGTGHGH